MFNTLKISVLLGASLILAACGGTMPTLGGSKGNDSVISGSAAGGSQVDKNDNLERCESTLGTLSVFEDQKDTWWAEYRKRYPRLGSTVPLIRLMVQQSNCFVIVERGRSMDAMMRERELMQSGQLRQGSNFGGGQMVAADYTLTPAVLFAEQGTGGIGAAIGGSLLGGVGKFVGGGVKKNESETNMTLIENRSGVQVASSVGSAKNYDFSLFGGLFGGRGAAGAGAFSKTPEGKVVSAAFADSYNQMVRALKQYKAQTVEGGLGKGGKLGIGGEDDKMPEATPLPQKPQAQVQPSQPALQTVVEQPAVAVVKQETTTVVRKRSRYISLDEIDEDAMSDYYEALKRSVEHLGNFSAMTKEQVQEIESQNTGGFGFAAAINMIWGGPTVTRLETSMVELQSWPPSAREEAWDVYGKRVESYNKLFLRNRDMILKNQAFNQSTLDRIAAVELLTEENFLIDE